MHNLSARPAIGPLPPPPPIEGLDHEAPPFTDRREVSGDVDVIGSAHAKDRIAWVYLDEPVEGMRTATNPHRTRAAFIADWAPVEQGASNGGYAYLPDNVDASLGPDIYALLSKLAAGYSSRDAFLNDFHVDTMGKQVVIRDQTISSEQAAVWVSTDQPGRRAQLIAYCQCSQIE